MLPAGSELKAILANPTVHAEVDSTGLAELLAIAGGVPILLGDIVRRQLVSDVPVCTLLSGGLDSSAVTALAARELKDAGKAVRTFSVDYAGNDRFFRASHY